MPIHRCVYFLNIYSTESICLFYIFFIQVIQREPWEHIRDEDIKKAAASFCGEIYQVPPMFSAIKVKEFYLNENKYWISRDVFHSFYFPILSFLHMKGWRRENVR